MSIFKRRFNPEKELNKIQNGNKKKTLIGIISLLVIIAIGSSFALYQVRNIQDIVYTKVGDFSGDIKIFSTVNDSSGYVSRSDGGHNASVSCTNPVSATWDYKSWGIEISSFASKQTNCFINYTTNSNKTYLNDKVTSLVGNGEVFNEEIVIVNSSFEMATAFESNQYVNVTNDPTYPYTWDATAKTWTSSNHTDSTISTFIFNPSTSGNYGFCYRQSSEKNYDYAQVYINNTEKINLKGVSNTTFDCKYLGNLSSSDQIKVTYRKDSSGSSGSDNIIFYLSNDENIETVNDIRYEGMNPNNYVWFNNELWRIIGVFDATTHGVTGESLVKIIRDESLGGLAWDKLNRNNWATSSLMNLLNGAYLNQEDGTNGDYCYGDGITVKAHCDYREKGISDDYRNMIETRVVWKLGGISSNINTAMSFYIAERGTTVYSGNATVWPNSSGVSYPIGLMYMSDYGYAVPSSSCARTTNLISYNNANCTLNNWLYGKGFEWTLTHSSSRFLNAFSFYDRGNVFDYYTSSGFGVRPALYLKSSVWVISGDGSEANPYVIGV